jgi:hypothetical protein
MIKKINYYVTPNVFLTAGLQIMHYVEELAVPESLPSSKLR